MHRECRGFCTQRAALKLFDRRRIRIEQIELGELMRQQRRIGEANIGIVGRHTRHRHRALGKSRNTVATHIIGGHHRLTFADEDAQADIVALGSLRRLDLAVAHLDALRDAAHRHRIGCIRPGAARRFDETLRQIRQCGLVEKIGCSGRFGKDEV